MLSSSLVSQCDGEGSAPPLLRESHFDISGSEESCTVALGCECFDRKSEHSAVKRSPIICGYWRALPLPITAIHSRPLLLFLCVSKVFGLSIDVFGSGPDRRSVAQNARLAVPRPEPDQHAPARAICTAHFPSSLWHRTATVLTPRFVLARERHEFCVCPGIYCLEQRQKLKGQTCCAHPASAG